MNERDARKALASTLGENTAVAFVEANDARSVDLVILKTSRRLTREQGDQLRARWLDAIAHTGLDGAAVIVVDGDVSIEMFRAHG